MPQPSSNSTEYKPRIDPRRPEQGFTAKQRTGWQILCDQVKKYIMFYGGSRSGKTTEAVYFTRMRCIFYPGSKHLVARYSFANAKKTVWLQTMLPQFRADRDAGLCKIQHQEGIVTYRNGSMVLLGGLEPSRIDSVLAAEYATIFVTEANENKFQDIEKLFSRLNDTSRHVQDGRPIKPKFICDLNPTVERNWTNMLFRRGIDPISEKARPNYHEFAYLHFRPEDNEENLAEGYIESLKAMSPANRKRFYEGEFGSYDGLVFQIDEAEHVVDDFEVPKDWMRARSIDFGYTHPFVCLWWAYDKANDVAYVYREHSQVKWTVNRHAHEIKKITKEEDFSGKTEADRPYAWTAADHDAEDRATLEEHGIFTEPANKEVLAGIDNIVDLLRTDEGHRTRIKIFRSCVKLRNGLMTYRLKDSAKRAKDREVVKEDDDEADAFRYGAMRMFPPVKPFQFERIEAV